MPTPRDRVPDGTCVIFSLTGEIYESADNGNVAIVRHAGTISDLYVGDSMNWDVTGRNGCWPWFRTNHRGELVTDSWRIVVPCSCPRHQGTPTFHESRS